MPDYAIASCPEARRVYFDEQRWLCSLKVVSAASGRISDSQIEDELFDFFRDELRFPIQRGPDWRYVQKQLGEGYKAKLYFAALDSLVEPEYRAIFSRACGIKRRRTYYRESSIQGFLDHKDKIIACANDGLTNLLPLVRLTGLSPAELKVAVGQSAWKRVANKPFYWVSAFSEAASAVRSSEERLTTTIALLKIISRRRNTLVHFFGNLVATYVRNHDPDVAIINSGPNSLQELEDELVWLDRHSEISNKYVLTYDQQIYSDTRAMAKTLGEPFNPQWGRRRMEEAHGLFSRAIRMRELSDDEFTKNPEWVFHTMDKGDVVAELLNSEASMGIEAAEQSNCLASYTPRVEAGQYFVYRLLVKHGQEQERLTIGFARLFHAGWELDQAYGRSNEPPTARGLEGVRQLCVALSEAAAQHNCTIYSEWTVRADPF